MVFHTFLRILSEWAVFMFHPTHLLQLSHYIAKRHEYCCQRFQSCHGIIKKHNVLFYHQIELDIQIHAPFLYLHVIFSWHLNCWHFCLHHTKKTFQISFYFYHEHACVLEISSNALLHINYFTNVESKISILMLNKFSSSSHSNALSLFFRVCVTVRACKSKSFNSTMQTVCETHLIYIFWNWRHRFNYSLWTYKLYFSGGRTDALYIYIVHNGTIWTNEKCKAMKNSILCRKSGWIPNVCDIICMQFHEFCFWFGLAIQFVLCTHYV